jgi:hypothetical protein
MGEFYFINYSLFILTNNYTFCSSMRLNVLSIKSKLFTV